MESGKVEQTGVNKGGPGSDFGTKLTRDRSPSDHGYVYFLRSGDAIKIGFSVHPIKRVDELQIGNPEELELICAVEALERDEGRLHAEYAHLQIRSEWFRAGPDLLTYIESLGLSAKAARTIQRMKRHMTPEAEAMLSKLAKLRTTYGAETRIGYRCSNLSEMIPNYQAETNPEARVHLAAGIERQTAELLKFMSEAN